MARTSTWFLQTLSAVTALAACSGLTPERKLGTTRGDAAHAGSTASSGNASPRATGGADVITMAALIDAGSPLARDTATAKAPITQPVPAQGALAQFTRDDTALGGLPTDVLQNLKTGADPCTSGIVYPSAGTIFPNGMLPPTLMWKIPAGQAQRGAYLRLRYAGADNLVDYQLTVDGKTPGQLAIPADAWTEISRRSNGLDLNVELKIGVGSKVEQCKTQFRIARGSMTGSLYYYQSATDQSQALTNAILPGGDQIGIFRLRLGTSENTPFLVPDGGFKCVGCHSMNARGNRLVTMQGDGLSLGFSSYTAFDVSPVKATMLRALDNTTLGALTPDGKYILTLGQPACTAGELTDQAPNANIFLLEGKSVAKLQDVDTGLTVPTKGLNPDHYMWMPQFSVDGTKVVFNHAKPDPARPGFTDRRELAIMDYDRTTQTFSNLKVILSRLGPEPTGDYHQASIQGLLRWPTPGRDSCTAPAEQINSSGSYAAGVCDEPCYPAWPSFTPDGKGVIFSLLDQPDFNHSWGRKVTAKAHLYYLDLKSGQTVRLENAMRVTDPAEYGRDNYPTVLPISVGGYAWLFWTARRSWGTRGDGLFSPVAGAAAATSVNQAGNPSARKIWVSAIRLDRSDSASSQNLSDPSAPGFYLEGQGARPSMRAYAALNPCSQDGLGCGSGIDCCSGFCTDGHCGLPQQPGCSKIMEACKSSADCCDPRGTTCVAGFCDVLAPD